MKDEEVENQKKNIKKVDEEEYLEVGKKMSRRRSRNRQWRRRRTIKYDDFVQPQHLCTEDIINSCSDLKLIHFYQ
jgi:hypothetical protein